MTSGSSVAPGRVVISGSTVAAGTVEVLAMLTASTVIGAIRLRDAFAARYAAQSASFNASGASLAATATAAAWPRSMPLSTWSKLVAPMPDMSGLISTSRPASEAI